MRDPKEPHDRLCVNCDATYPANPANTPLPKPSDDTVSDAVIGNEEGSPEGSDSDDEASTASLDAQTNAQANRASHNGPAPSAGAAPPPSSASPGPMHPTANGAASAATRERNDRASEEIAQKLLQGWALLDQTCPR